jgi:hypothetical protein
MSTENAPGSALLTVDWAAERAKSSHLRFRAEHDYGGGTLTHIAPGLLGRLTTLPDGTAVYTLVVSEQPGQGNLGRFLDSLNPTGRYVAAGLTSAIVAGMLRRRGFADRTLTLYGAPGIPCLVRGPSPEAVDDIARALETYARRVFPVPRDHLAGTGTGRQKARRHR